MNMSVVRAITFLIIIKYNYVLVLGGQPSSENFLHPG
jgi:hypothetical protein